MIIDKCINNVYFLIMVSILLFTDLCFCSDSIVNSVSEKCDNNDSMKKCSNITKYDYLDIVINTFKKQNTLTTRLENKLTSQASTLIADNIHNNGGNNHTIYKYNVFKDLFPDFISLSNTGLEENASKLQIEKANFFPQYLETGFVLFFSRKPLDESERKEVKNLLSKLKNKYVETIGIRYPDYKILSHDHELRNIVYDHVEKNVVYTIENYFDIDSCYFSIKNLRNQIANELPKIKTTFPNAGDDWLKRLKNPDLNRQKKASFEMMYKDVISNEIEEVLNGWEQLLFVHNRDCDKGFKILSDKVPGIPIKILYHLLVKHAKAWNAFMKKIPE